MTVTIDRRRGEDGWGAAAAAPTPPLSPFGAAVNSSVGSVTGGCVPLGLSNIVVATPAPSPSPLAASTAKISPTAAAAAAVSSSERYAATSQVSAAGSNANDADYGLQRAFMAQPRVIFYYYYHFYYHLNSFEPFSFLLGWKLSPLVFYHYFTLRNATGLSFQANSQVLLSGWKLSPVAFYH